MSALLAFIKWIIVGLILVGIVYNFALPFTPPWLDVIVWTGVASAFLIAVILVQYKKKQDEENGSGSKK